MKMNLTIGLFIATLAVHAQTLAFEVTSVKLNTLAPRERHVEGASYSPSGRFVSLGLNLRVAFFWGFNLRPFQVTGLPGWIDASDAIYDIEARSSGPVSEDQCRLMVQALFAERFKLAFRRSKSEIPAYALTVVKNGTKMHLVNPDDKPKPGGGVRMFGNPVRGTPGSDPSRGWTMEALADYLTGQPAVDGRPVVDRTGLAGIYEIDLDYAFRVGANNKPEIFDAIQEQLGLKLDSIKAPFDLLVVEHLEKPDAN